MSSATKRRPLSIAVQDLQQLREWLEAGRPPAEIVEEWQEQAKQFENRRERYLLY